ncbi:MAG: HAD family hydrolase [Slackia piriformis]|uniref:HAD family hydrolase n=1 Tax=Slackia piriformis TaxID=626934 RepID=A0A943UU49_9ACTN|nr:HAD family hydrolase [Slackia piriformis]
MQEPRAYTTVFFDLDGTLLPIDTGDFMSAYTVSLGEFAHDRGLDGRAVMEALFAGVKAMAKNDGARTNRDMFWDAFSQAAGMDARTTETLFDEYYDGPFNDIARLAAPNPAAARAIAALKSKGYAIALTTMPMFPLKAVHARLKWAGLDAADFAFVTDYATATSVKPQVAYYEEALRRAGAEPAEVLMVGNNTREDGAAYRAGCDIYFVTDNLIESEDGLNVAEHKHGTLEDFARFCEGLPSLA